MKNLITILFLAFAGALFAQPVRTTITDDGSNVTVQTPVNVKVIPICDFHWLFTDGNLQLWVEGRNELIPGGRLGNFTVNGATTQASKLAALGAISDQCGGAGSGIDSLYYGGTLLDSGDTIPVGGAASNDSLVAHRTDINNLQTLSGRPDGSTHLGTMSQGTQYPDNLSIKTFADSTDAKLGRISGIDTLANYTTLYAYTGASKALYVNDFYSSTGGSASGQKWRVQGGLFVNVSNPGFSDGGTVILATNGKYWQRVWDRNVFLPEFWAVDSVTHNTSTIFYDGASAINRAFYTAYTNYRPSLTGKSIGNGVVSLTTDQTYMQSKHITMYEGQILRGNNARIFKKNAVTAITTTATAIGGTTVTVDDATGFIPGMQFTVVRDSSYDENSGEGSVIASVVGNVITVTGAFERVVAIGSVAISIPAQIIAADNGTINSLIIENVRFDGNQAGNNYCYDWELGTTINAAGITRVSITGCHFEDIPNENIFIGQGEIKTCTGKRLWGSFSHTSAGTGVVLVQNVTLDSVCIIGTATTGHSEGAFTISTNVSGYTIRDCVVRNSFEAILGNVSYNTNTVLLDNVRAYNCNGINWWPGGAVGLGPIKNLTIQNSYFEDCKDLIVYASGGVNIFNSTDGIQNAKIVNNTFYNSRLFMGAFKHAEVVNNNWYFTPGTGYSQLTTPTAGLTNNKAVVDLQGSWHHFDFKDNYILGDSAYSASGLLYGVFLSVASGSLNDTLSGGTIIKRSQMSEAYIKHNEILEMKMPIRGFMTGTPPQTNTVSWFINDNYLVGNRQAATYSAGVPVLGVLLAGTEFKGNTVVNQAETAFTMYLRIRGVEDNADTAYVEGCRILDNNFKGCSIQVGEATGSNSYNNIILDNFVDYAITGYDLTKNYIANNTLIDSSVLPAMTNRKKKRIVYKSITP